MVAEKYKVKKTSYWNPAIGNTRGYQIWDGDNTAFFINMWLHELTSNTARTYAYEVCSWLNYCASIGKSYLTADEHDLNTYINDMRFKDTDGIFHVDHSNHRYATIRKHINSITAMYSYIENIGAAKQMPVVIEKDTGASQYSYLANITWTKERKKLIVNKYIDRYKPKKKYVKWYSDEQIGAILDNLKLLRDKTIFLMTLDDMRIDEVLSLRMDDYNPHDRSVIAYRSKGRVTGETGRGVALSDNTVKMLEDYLMFERAPIEYALLAAGSSIAANIFINETKGIYYGNPVGYQNFRKILRLAGDKAGIDGDMIRTHSGRSTSVMRDILYHVEHPELLSLEDIRIKYGWSSITSIRPYLDTSNPLLSMKNRKLLDKVKQTLDDKYGATTGFREKELE